MSIYRRKSVLAEAIQWFEYLGEIQGVYVIVQCGAPTYFIETVNGTVEITDGDWIVEDEYYAKTVIKDGKFKEQYELWEFEDADLPPNND